MKPLAFTETYLYKIHSLANAMDKLFDRTLRRYANLSLSQFMLLISVAHHEVVNQRKVAHFLQVSPAAINRQVDIAVRSGRLNIRAGGQDHGSLLILTPEGDRVIQACLAALDQHVFTIFADDNRQASLMSHIDLLISKTKGAVDKQAAAMGQSKYYVHSTKG